MTEKELAYEHRVVYETRLGILGVVGIPSSEQHNLAVLEANEVIIKLRKDDNIVAKLRALRESL